MTYLSILTILGRAAKIKITFRFINLIDIIFARIYIFIDNILKKVKEWDFVPFPLLSLYGQEGIRRDRTVEQMSLAVPPRTKLRWKKTPDR